MNYQVQRIIIDPERLIEIKRQRKSLKMVPSAYEPPPDPQSTQQPIHQPKTIDTSTHHHIEISANYSFIESILSKKAMSNYCTYEEGDCIPLSNKGEDRWLLVGGKIQVIGINNYSYTMSSGYFFFLSKETKRKIKQVISLTSTKLILIEGKVVDDYLRNYLFLKNIQKIKYLKQCPFLIWNQLMWEDLAMSMELMQFQKDQVIYTQDQQSGEIYFVKDGIVLLERTRQIHNGILKDYESHYEKDEVEGDALLVVRKGMIFGMDGVFFNERNLPNIDSKTPPDNNQEETMPLNILHRVERDKRQKNKIGVRLYTAKTMGRCEVYKLRKEVLNVFFNMKDILRKKEKGRQLSSKELERISKEYIQLLGGNSKVSRDLPQQNNSLADKKKKIGEIKDFEKKVRKISIQSIMKQKSNDNNRYIQEMNPFTYPKTQAQLNRQISNKLIALNPQRSVTRLPLLKNRHLERTLSRKQQIKDKQIQQYKMFKKAVEAQILNKSAKTPQNQQSSYMQINSYKSIVSQLT